MKKKTPIWKKIQDREDYHKKEAFFLLNKVLLVQERHKLDRFFPGLPKHIKVTKFKFVVNQSCKLFLHSDDAYNERHCHKFHENAC